MGTDSSLGVFTPPIGSPEGNDISAVQRMISYETMDVQPGDSGAGRFLSFPRLEVRRSSWSAMRKISFEWLHVSVCQIND